MFNSLNRLLQHVISKILIILTSLYSSFYSLMTTKLNINYICTFSLSSSTVTIPWRHLWCLLSLEFSTFSSFWHFTRKLTTQARKQKRKWLRKTIMLWTQKLSDFFGVFLPQLSNSYRVSVSPKELRSF